VTYVTHPKQILVETAAYVAVHIVQESRIIAGKTAVNMYIEFYDKSIMES